VHALADLVARDDAYGEVFNIGSTEEISILALAQWIRGMSESQSEITVVPYDEAYEAGFEDMRRRVPDISKIDQLLGWRPTKDLNGIPRRGASRWDSRKPVDGGPRSLADETRPPIVVLAIGRMPPRHTQGRNGVRMSGKRRGCER
jgi:hypothetical protein